ncbi:MAG: hypothetical protein O6939_11685, partial [Bacteroidetes bacterium]|nr:hypothetical protein [Bacteroidota bacterium]
AIMGAYLGLRESNEPSSTQNPHLVMAVGNGQMWVIDTGEDLTIGDYLISSEIEGHAMKDQGDYEVSYVIGRVAEPVDWSQETQIIVGRKHKKISVFFENFENRHQQEPQTLTAEVQNQRALIENQQRVIDQMQKENENMKAELAEIKRMLGIDAKASIK